MEDVATRVGVSRALVSIVFRDVPGASESTRARVLAAAEELGYQPDRRASRLGRVRTRMIGVVFDLGHDFHAEVIDGLYASADQHGYEIVLNGVTARRSETSAVRAALGERCEGVVLIGPQLRTREIAELAQRVPTVVVLRQVRLREVDVIRTDEHTGVEQLIDHLRGLGHERILHLDGGRAPGAAQRRHAYLKAMTAHGLDPQSSFGGVTEEAGARAANMLLEGSLTADQPTAIAAFNDRCALGVLHRLLSHGVQVPETLSIAGFDDITAAGYEHIGLTTIRQDADRLGGLALDRLRMRLEDNELPSSAGIVPPRLVVRTTTGPPRH